MSFRVVIVFLIAAIIAFLPVRFAVNFFLTSRDYQQAEPLVGLVWPLSSEIRNYKIKKGVYPKNLVEIDEFSTAYDFSTLRKYTPDFQPQNGNLFYMAVNSRFGFSIDADYHPNWVDIQKAATNKNTVEQGAAANP